MHNVAHTKHSLARSFLALLRREFQQHRGALWITPWVVGGLLVLIALMGTLTGHGFNVQLGSDASPKQLLKYVGNPEFAYHRQLFLQAFHFGVLTVFHGVLFVVVVLYCLGALYDERRERSILFWKSMPVTDTRTVLAKLATAMLVAPLLMVLVFALTYLLLLGVLSINVWRLGISPWAAIWSSPAVWSPFASTLVVELINPLWLLPLTGWLLFCSSFSKIRPILWAASVPFAIWLVGRWINWSGFAQFKLHQISDWIFSRFAAGLTPLGASGQWSDVGHTALFRSADQRALQALTGVDLWIGVAIGLALVGAAIYWRRYRDDSL